MTVVAVMVGVIVAPGPVFFLLFRRQLAEIAVAVTVCLLSPAMVVHHFVVVPRVIVGVVRIINTVGVMLRASDSRQARSQRSRQQQGSQRVRSTNHELLRIT